MTASMLGAAAWHDLAAGLDGQLILPGDPGYGDIRKPQIRHLTEALPQAVVRCAGTSDVTRAVRFAGANGLPLAIRGGGHSLADYSSTDGLLLDLRAMDTIYIGPNAGHVTVGPGVTVGELAHRLAPLGRLVPCGWWPTVGVTGAVLGGGYGLFSRLYGLGCDHLISADVVLADGNVVRADAEQHPDLFWALRGAGGGNFGVVTSMWLRTSPAIPATVFAIGWQIGDAAHVTEVWQQFAPTAPGWVNAELGFVAGPDPESIPLAIAFGAIMASPKTAAATIAELELAVGIRGRRLAYTELSETDSARHFSYMGVTVQAALPAPPIWQTPGLRVLKSEYFDSPLPRHTIGQLVDNLIASRLPGQHRELEFVPWGGAYGRVPGDVTAFPHRAARFLLEHNADVGSAADAALRSATHDWVNRSWETAHPSGNGLVYPNYPDPDLPHWASAYFGTNLSRLRSVKSAYDPHNFFRFAQSIPPSR
jgi:hypothetical protein